MSHMQEDMDLALALQLQEQEQQSINKWKTPSKTPKNGSDQKSVADPCWETIDPVPDVHALFLQFNDEYFWGKLVGVEVKWSPRMTLCAGLCCYEGRGGLCSVRLSQPLLKLRPRSDLVETLLHEMIHAYLFVTANNKDHDAHGPEFLSHMRRINKSSGANVTVYHSFHDEVDHYRTHVWLCDGVCRQRPPFYGYVKRAMNRAPGPNDTWWSEHRATCGGAFVKVKEPEGFGEKKRKQNGSFDSPAKRRNVEPNKAQPTFIPFAGRGHVLGTSTSTTTNKHSQFVQPPILGFLKTINVTPEMNRRNKIEKTKNTTTTTTTTPRPGVVSLSEYLRSTGAGDAPTRKRYSVARTKKRSSVPLYFSDSEDEIDEIAEIDEIDQTNKSSPSCPVCALKIDENHINEHLDVCLVQNFI